MYLQLPTKVLLPNQPNHTTVFQETPFEMFLVHPVDVFMKIGTTSVKSQWRV